MPPTVVEINLRIPSVKEPLKDVSGWPISNGDIRFLKRITVPSLPKPGDAVELSALPDHAFQATVVQANWHEEKQVFVVACKYAKTSIPRPQYLAIMEDPEWTRKPLLG